MLLTYKGQDLAVLQVESKWLPNKVGGWGGSEARLRGLLRGRAARSPVCMASGLQPPALLLPATCGVAATDPYQPPNEPQLTPNRPTQPTDPTDPNRPTHPQALEAKLCYGTSSIEHPGVQMITMERGRYYLGGTVVGLELPKRCGAERSVFFRVRRP